MPVAAQVQHPAATAHAFPSIAHAAPAVERKVESPAWEDLAKLMWQHRGSEIAGRLERDLQTVQVPERSRRCQLCKCSLGTPCVEMHIRSDSHLKNVALTMRFLINKNVSLGSMGGAGGPRVQLFEGTLGNAWFNHLTGESGIVPDTRVAQGAYLGSCYISPVSRVFSQATADQ